WAQGRLDRATQTVVFRLHAEGLRADGWPVFLRATGGDVTPQGPGVVNVTHVYAVPPTKAFDMQAEYDRLCRPIEAALGPGASRGWQPGAFCDGAHNVQWAGRKFAGTAMRFRPCRIDKTRYAVLAHALMLFTPPKPDAIAAINRFLAAIEEDRVIRDDAHTGLPDGVSPKTFVDRLRAAFDAVVP
ncbi:MAG: lipoate--protein ligase family protein, partial [Pseudomonadota bacterium]